MEAYSCWFVDGMNLHIIGNVEKDENIITLCCGEDFSTNMGIPLMETAEETLNAFLAMRAMVIAEGIQRNAEGNASAPAYRYTASCENCMNYRLGHHTYRNQITYIDISIYPSPCQAKCSYCIPRYWHDTPKVREQYAKLFSFLHLIQERGLVAPDAVWHIAPGEIAVHPYRGEILSLIKGKRAIFCTNAFLFDKSIASHLHEQPDSYIILSMDAGTAETWKSIKGADNFKEVLANLKQYHKESAKPGQIKLKYIILPGQNDTDEDFRHFLEIAKALEVREIILSRDAKYKYTTDEASRTSLLASAARLMSMCRQQNLLCDTIHFSEEEQQLLYRSSHARRSQTPLWKRLVKHGFEKLGYTVLRI